MVAELFDQLMTLGIRRASFEDRAQTLRQAGGQLADFGAPGRKAVSFWLPAGVLSDEGLSVPTESEMRAAPSSPLIARSNPPKAARG